MVSHEQAQQVETPAHHPQGRSYQYAIVAGRKELVKRATRVRPVGGVLWGARPTISTRQSRKRVE
eukprot:6189312-Pleurochrysis_carterae.AAC.1